MFENLVLLTGTVLHVSIKPMDNWVRASFKLDCGNFQTWVEIKGLGLGDKAVSAIQALKDQRIVIRGRLTSYVKKPNPPEYPNETKHYQISVSKGGIDLVPSTDASSVNFCLFGGTIQEVRTSRAGVRFAEVGIPYHNPSTDSYGTYLARVRYPTDADFPQGEKVMVMGSVADAVGVLVIATQILKTQKPPTPSLVASDVSES